ncbi:MAG: hypothetical protein GC159_04105 [Phycisphaera sp.]|nr:hypothetical protein [Phycisphaera sp.]
MPNVDLEQQAKIVRAIVPAADIRTDQSDILRACYAMLLGGVRPLPDGSFEWSITDLAEEGPISCITAPPVKKAIEQSQFEAARSMANELSRLASQRD